MPRSTGPAVGMPPPRGYGLAQSAAQQHQPVHNTPVGVNYFPYAAQAPSTVALAANVPMHASSSYPAQVQSSSVARAAPSVPAPASSHAQALMDVNVDTSQNLTYDQTQYEAVLRSTAEQLLATLQSQMMPHIPENQRYTLDRVKQERNELYLEVSVEQYLVCFPLANYTVLNCSRLPKLFQNAQNSLAEKGIVCWDVRYMQGSGFASSVVVKLLKLGSSSGHIKDEDANLLFASEDHRAQYLASLVAAKKALELGRVSENSQLKSRNWYQGVSEWCEEKPWEGIIDRVFSTAAEETIPTTVEQPIPTTPMSKKAKVIADDAYKSCPLCGEEFERVWDDEVNDWIYANAVRPDPNGPIYMEKAYLKRSASMDLNSPAKRRRVVPGE